MTPVHPLLVFGYLTVFVLFILRVVCLVKRRRKLKPMTLVARHPVAIDNRSTGAPYGIVSINGVKVRVRDTVILTSQGLASSNGVWTVTRENWQRPSEDVNNPGRWMVTSSGDLWAVSPTSGRWERVDPGTRILTFSTPEIAPSNPAEAAAYLHRLGIFPDRIRQYQSRFRCIESLVSNRSITRGQGDLLLAKPENLTTQITTAFGTVRFNGQTWIGQVVAYMNSIQRRTENLVLTHEASEEMLTPPPSTKLSEGFKEIAKPLEPPPRRSRYKRERVI